MAAVPGGLALNPLPALIQGVAGQGDHVEGIHHRYSFGQLFGGGGLEPREPICQRRLKTGHFPTLEN
ncbi:hypothetical protein GCM10028800_06420 [Nesterenkonia populi]